MNFRDLLPGKPWKRDEQRSGSMAWWGAGIDTTPPSGLRAVSESQASRLVPVWAAWRSIIDFVSTLPINAYTEQPDGSRTRRPLPLLLARQDLPGYPGLDNWIGQALYGLVSVGNAVGFITDTDGFGFPTDVQWIGKEHWQWDKGQWYIKGSPVPSSSILHIPWIVPAGKTLGMSPIEHQASIIGVGLSAQAYADVRRGGGVPPSILKNMFETLDNEQSEIIRQRAMASFSSGKPFVVGKDWDLELPAIPPNQAMFIQTLELTANDIAAIYGVDPREVGGTATDSLTYSTDESKVLNRGTNVDPYIRRIKRAIDRALPAPQCIEFDLDSKIRADVKTLTETLGWQVADGRLSVNEARAIKGLQPVPGGDVHNFLGSAVDQPRPVQEPTRNENPSEETR